MFDDWQTLNVVLALISAAVSLALAIYSWRHHEITGALYFAILIASVSLVSLCYAFELTRQTLAGFIFWSKVEYIGLVTIPVAWLVFALAFSGYEHWFTPPRLLVLSIISIITLILAWTNEWHGLMWKEPRLGKSGELTVFQPVYGAWFWVNLVYVYLLFVIGTFFLLRVAVRSWSQYRAQSVAILLGAAIPWLGNLTTILDINIVRNIHPIPVSFTTGMVILAWALFQFRFIETLPLAYDMVLHHIPDGLLVLDARGKIVSFNRTVSLYLEIPARKAPGKAVYEVFPSMYHHFAPFLDTAETLTEIHVDNRDIEVRIVSLYNRRQRFKGRLMLFRDITQRKQAELARQQQQQILEAIYSSTALLNSTLELDAVMNLILQAVRRVVTHNYSNIMLVEPDGKTARIRYVHNTSPEREAILREFVFHLENFSTFRTVMATQKPLIIPDTAYVSDWDQVSDMEKAIRSYACAPIRIEGKLIGFLNLDSTTPGTLTPAISDRLQLFADQAASAIKNARLYEKVKQLEQLKTDMIRIAAHDLRNPVSVATGTLQLLDDGSGNLTPEQQVLIDRSLESLALISRIIQDILSLERIEQVASHQTMIRVNLGMLAKAVVQDYQAQAEEKSVRLNVSPEENATYFLFADPVQIREAITNLINNAVKYTPSGGEICVKLSRTADEISLEVVDTGYGIPETMQARLFQPFYRATTRDTELIQGTGLGLHLVKNIVQRHGGRLIFHSTYGKGSTFGFSLPAIEQRSKILPDEGNS